MNRKKRTFKPVSFFVTWILVLTLLVTMIPASAFATEVEETETTVEAVSTEESVVESAVAAETEAVIEAAEEIVSETEASATEEVSTEEISTEETDIEEDVSSDDVSAEGESSILIEETDQTEEIVETVGETETEVEAESETEVAYQAGTFTHTGKDYVITVSYDEEACLPEGTQLVVKELTEKAADYESYYDKAEEAVASDENTEIKEIRLFDIAFEYEGEAVEPKAAVNVTIKAQYEETPASEDISVVHIPDEADTEVLASDCTVTSERDNDNSEVTAEFTSDSFSVYAVVVTTLETNYITADGASYKITVTFDEDAGIPADAELKVEEILPGTAAYDSYSDKAASELDSRTETAEAFDAGFEDADAYKASIVSLPDEGEAGFARYFDISIISNGQEIEPEAPVEVKIEYEDPIELSENEELQIVHFADDGIEVISPEINDNEIVFEQDSFSVTGTVVTSLSNGQRYALLVDYNSKTYEVMFDGTLQEVTPVPDTTDQYTVEMAEAWQWTGNRLRVQKASGSEYIDPTENAGMGTTSRTITRELIGGNGYNLSNSNEYLGVTIDATSGQPIISGNNSKDDAAVFYFATVQRTTTGRTVDHIDIGVEAKATVSVPLAYGEYYDSEGNVIETVALGERKYATGVNNEIPISEADLMSATISSYTMDGTERVPDNSFVINEYTSSTQQGEIDQVRVGGTFPVGWVELSGNGSRGNIEQYITSQNQVYYEVDVSKPVELTLQKKVGDEMVTLYQKDAEGNLVPLTVTVNVNLVSNFSFWDDDNECPGIQYISGYSRNGTGQSATASLSPAGMDFRLGTSDDTNADLGAIEIIKYVVDEHGQPIALQSDVQYTFDVFNDEDGDVTAPTAWSGETTATIDRSGYTDLADRDVKVTASSGMGVAYDYSVDQGLVYIAEKNPAQTVTDANGKTLKYKETYITTEYAWRDNSDTTSDPSYVDKTHSNKKQSDTLVAIPDVVGDYYSTTYDGELHNTFLEFYVYNVYAPDSGDLEVTKTVESDFAADKQKAFSFTVTLSDKTINGTYGEMEFTNGVATFTLKDGESLKAEGLPDGVTYTVTETAVDGFTTTKTGDTGTISGGETSTAAFTNTRQTGNLEVTKTVTSALAADKNLAFNFTVTLSDTTISGTFGDMSFTNGVAEFTLKDGESKSATGLPAGVTYTVTETTADGFTTTKTGDTGTISADQTASSEFTNTRETGDLEVTKTVVSDASADKDQEFEFTVTLGDTSINGTFGDMTFEDGVAEFTLKDGESKTATGLPTTVTYTVTEKSVEGFTTTYDYNSGTISATKSTSEFTNTRVTSGLAINKTVVSDAAADKDKEFTFTVTLGDTTISGTYGDLTFTNGVATTTLKGGEKAESTGLPTGISYTVEETNEDGFTTTSTGETGTIEADTAATAAFTNTRETGDLEVTKTVVSDLAADKDLAFEFTVTLSDTTISGTYGDMTFENGVAEFTLKDGESKSAEGLPTDVTYTVVETPVDGFDTTSTGDSGTISTTASAAAFTNTRETGDLEVTKTVVSDATADKDLAFEFTVTLSDTTISGTYGDMTFADGVAEFTLKDGESKSATGLPTTVTYDVVETPVDGFDTISTGDSGEISTEISTAAFTNTRKTGDLEVTKTVESDLAADEDQEFNFTVTLGDTGINGTYGDMEFTNGVAAFTLKGGESAVATGLPTGISYTVEEETADGFVTTKIGDTGDIAETAATAAFTNTRETGDLEVTKTVESDLAADKDLAFEFTVTLSDTSITGTFGEMSFDAGVATFTLKDGESKTAEGLPTTVTYTVVETPVDGFTTTSTGDSGEISTTKSTAAFTNTRETGDLEVSKTVVSDLAADKDLEFEFTVTLGDTTINGTFGDMTFTDGVAEFTLKHDEKATATGLPTTVTYTVEEATAGGFSTTYTSNSGTISTTKSTAAFTNTRITSGLIINKTVVSDLDADKDREFEFTVTLGDTTINGTYGDLTFANGVATITLKGGESASAEGLPISVTYTVVETPVDNFETEKTGDTGTIEEGDAATASFTNTRKTGDLEVKKTVESDLAADKDVAFEFTVTLSDTTINGTFGEMTFTNGVATFTLKDGESKKAEGLPTEVTYTVEETAVDEFTTTSTGEIGEISADETASAEFTNTRDTADLEVKKIVASDLAADKDQEFEFTVTLGDTTISGTYGDMTFADGVATFTLKDGESKKAEGLPTSLSYTVEETAADGFTTTSTGETGTISADEPAAAEFTNTRETADLEVKKIVASDLAADKDQEFEFTVTLGDTTINGTYGEMTFTDGVATFTLKDGESKKAEGLPTSLSYTVEETTANGFTTTSTGETGEISAEEPAAAEFTNTRETGDLEVKKIVVSDATADKDKTFEFTVTLSDTTINGTYGDMIFADGVATFTLKDGETATAKGLPTTVSYTVEETADDGFTTTSTGETGEIDKEISTAEFTNTRKTGDLEITKTVVSSTAGDKEKSFTFTVTLDDTGINGTYGDLTFDNGEASIELSDGESAAATGLPVELGYTVKEETADGFVTTYTGSTGKVKTETSTAAFTNTRIEGGLAVTKSVVSPVDADKTQKFSFTVTLSDTTISGTYSDMTFTDGVAEFELADGESSIAEGLPAGISYTVVETADDKFIATKTGDTGTINEDEASIAEFTNTRKTGDLEVSKTVVSDAEADEGRAFKFTIKLSDTTISGTFGDMSFSKGVATVTLKDGETAVAEGLPTEVTYTVTEAAAAGFTTEKTGDTGTISEEVSTAEFTNTRETGDLEVTKTVVSKDEADKTKAFTFTVTLSDTTISDTYGDMTFSGGVATFTLKDGESAMAEGLPTDISYTVEETPVEGFTTEKTGDTGKISTEPAVAEFTNTREDVPDEPTTFTVKKVWDDNNNEDGIRPKKIKVQLYANGKECGSVVTLDKNSGWKYTWTDLPMYEDGKLIKYVVKEIECPKGYKASYKRGDYETTITNKHSKHPITGDSSQVMLWIMMMLASMAGLGFSIYEKKRTR